MNQMTPAPIIIRSEPDICPGCGKEEEIVEVCAHCGHEYEHEYEDEDLETLDVLKFCAIVFGGLWFAGTLVYWFFLQNGNDSLFEILKSQGEWLINLVRDRNIF